MLPPLLQRLLAEPFFAASPPKSSGRDLFNLRWLEAQLQGDEAPQDVQATLLEYENRIKIGYRISDIETGERLTKGYTTQVAVDATTRELQFVSPPIVFANIEKACSL